MKLSLLVMTAGKQEGKLLEIKLPQFLIGRDPQCHLRPASAMISKRHCAVIIRDNKAFIRDFGSTNGTYLNDERVEGEQELKNDDQLKIGPIHFAVRLDASAPAGATPAPATRAAGMNKTPAPPTKPVTKTAPAPNDTPVPATVNKVSFKPSDDDGIDIASLLLAMDDGTESPVARDADGVPEGSTVMDMVVPSEVGVGKPGEGKDAAKAAAKSNTGDTRSAAAKILDQMTKRPRNIT